MQRLKTTLQRVKAHSLCAKFVKGQNYTTQSNPIQHTQHLHNRHVFPRLLLLQESKHQLLKLQGIWIAFHPPEHDGGCKSLI